MSGKTADYKVIVIGPSDAGKTALMERFVNDQFRVEKTTTIGVSFLIKTWHNIHLAIWDTAGQEKFAPLTQFYARDASAAIIAFDLTDREGFETIDKWIAYVSQNAKTCARVIVGCKVDICHDRPASRKVSKAEGEMLAERVGAVAYIETSSKTGINIEQVFDVICEKLRPGSAPVSRLSSAPPTPTTPVHNSPSINMNKPNASSEDKGCCN
eukprot:m.28917 g.28917  ORF g.28917 m.28917 type:complete len:212 (+) comp6102_c0_seq6:218-853(+)